MLFLLFQCYPADSDLRLALSFILSISYSNFGDSFYQHIPNRVMIPDNFSSLFAQILNDYMTLISNQSAQNYFFCVKKS